MIPLTLRLLCALLSYNFLASCSGGTEPNEPSIAGIVRTFANGQIEADEDPSDWQPRYDGVSEDRVMFEPASPNPIAAGLGTSFAVHLPVYSTIRVWVVNRRGTVVREIVNVSSHPAGRAWISWDLKNSNGQYVPGGLYRVRFEIISEEGSLERVGSFGDIKVIDLS